MKGIVKTRVWNGYTEERIPNRIAPLQIYRPTLGDDGLPSLDEDSLR